MPRRQSSVPALRPARKGTFAAVFQAFRVAELSRKKPGTQLNWGRELSWFEYALGDLPIKGPEDEIISCERVQIYFDGLNHLPGRQKMARTIIRRVERWALKRKLLVTAISKIGRASCRRGE